MPGFHVVSSLERGGKGGRRFGGGVRLRGRHSKVVGAVDGRRQPVGLASGGGAWDAVGAGSAGGELQVGLLRRARL